jgi:hypothetical protein
VVGVVVLAGLGAWLALFRDTAEPVSVEDAVTNLRLLDAVAELPAGPVTLARLCGTPLVPFSVLPVAPRRWRIEVEPPLPPPDRSAGEAGERALLQALADRWTQTLRTHAEHWAAVYPMTWRQPE